jgi:nucleotide-binding universal stress UspA family protein
MEYKSIVCGVTASTRAQRAALDAARLARRTGARLTYVHVVDISFFQEGMDDSLSRAFVAESLVRLGMQIVVHAAQIAITEGIVAEKHLAKGAVRKSLHRVARELGADLLVQGGDDGQTVFRDVLKLTEMDEPPTEVDPRTQLENRDQQAS